MSTHIPLVERILGPKGVTVTGPYLPDGVDDTSLAVVMLAFDDAAARNAAVSSPDAGEVFADVANFTDVQPVVQSLTTTS